MLNNNTFYELPEKTLEERMSQCLAQIRAMCEYHLVTGESEGAFILAQAIMSSIYVLIDGKGLSGEDLPGECRTQLVVAGIQITCGSKIFPDSPASFCSKCLEKNAPTN